MRYSALHGCADPCDRPRDAEAASCWPATTSNPHSTLVLLRQRFSCAYAMHRLKFIVLERKADGWTLELRSSAQCDRRPEQACGILAAARLLCARP